MIYRWDVRVKLSPEVFKVLQERESLKRFHLRMPEAFPARTLAMAPASTMSLVYSFVPLNLSPGHQHPVPPQHIHAALLQQVHNGSNQGTSIHIQKPPEALSQVAKQPPMFRGFTGLKCLAILDMDTTAYAFEISQCIKNSSSSLESLTLSFSERMAAEARTPYPPAPVTSDSEQNDDPTGQASNAPPWMLNSLEYDTTAKEKQEAFLRNIFGICSERESSPEEKKPSATSTTSTTRTQEQQDADSIQSLHFLAKYVPSAQPETEVGQEALKFLTQHSAEYVTGEDGDLPIKADSSISSVTPSSSRSSGGFGALGTGSEAIAPTKKTHIDAATPDDIDVDKPEAGALILKDSEPVIPAGVDMAPETDTDQASLRPNSSHGIKSREDVEKSDDCEARNYSRVTRGLAIRRLSLCTIPVSSSIITRYLDVTCLQAITLLDTGRHVKLWQAFSKHPQVSQLQLSKIHTDHVTVELLIFLHKLPYIEELILIEKPQRTEKESTALRTPITIKEIRKAVLNKHAGNLKVLACHSVNCSDWDLDTTTAMLLCHRASALEELAFSVSFPTLVSHPVFPHQALLFALQLEI